MVDSPDNTRESIAQLSIEREGAEVEERDLFDGDTIRIGRIPPNELVIVDKKVSRFHAVMSASGFGVILSDLSSLNGSFVNNKRVSTPVNLSSGDVITIGNARIIVNLKNLPEMLVVTESGDTMTTQAVTMKAAVVTLLVADVRNYTKLSEALPPADVTNMLQAWFNSVTNVVEKFNGEVDKYIGDCVMAVWAGSHENAAEIATKAAQAAREILLTTAYLAYSGTWKHGGEHPWECKISLNTGEAFTGPMGGRRARDFTVVGDTVNVAFRLDKVASEKDCEILLSGQTAALIKDVFEVTSLGSVTVEGRKRPVDIFSMAVK